MPSLLEQPFPRLIRQIPVARHSIELEAAFWRQRFHDHAALDLWEQIFGEEERVRISRDRLQNHPFESVDQKCAEILLWGYPRDSRGQVSRLLEQIPEIAETASAECDWMEYFDALNAFDGVNASKITKFAYFFRRTFAGLDALIMDRRLIANTARWDETAVPGLAYHNARRCYPDFLAGMHEAARRVRCAPDQLELFLFSLGDGF